MLLPTKYLFIASIFSLLFLTPSWGIGQEVKDVEQAFKELNPLAQTLTLKNELNVPRTMGHLQGIQVIGSPGQERLLISGSSKNEAYLLEADIEAQKTERLITLMKDPYRHAGGIQVCDSFLVVGIEDNFKKNASKVCLFNFQRGDLSKASPTVTLERKGNSKRYTAGATGLLKVDTGYLLVVGNWDSRNWDFYQLPNETFDPLLIASFAAPEDWGSYQSINLIKDKGAIYAIGFFKTGDANQADLILISQNGSFELIMKKVFSQTFHCTDGADFGSAAGLQVDHEGKLHLIATQRDALKQIVFNRFSQK